ncbi:MAG: ABC transporter permease subunit [Verrucomicrobiae bacterium]|nr:ABC transporter permease subunit [Verrucomicrobiae bacterium]
MKTGRRWTASRSVLWMDGFMNRFIPVGGMAVITVVLGIFLFILWQALPLFGGARVEALGSVSVPPGDYRVLGLDDNGERPFLVEGTGRIWSVDFAGGGGVEAVDPGWGDGGEITALHFRAARQELAVGTEDGRWSVVTFSNEPVWVGERREARLTARATPWGRVGPAGSAVRALGYGDGGESRLMAAIKEVEGRTELHAVSVVQERTLFGEVTMEIQEEHDLSARTRGRLDRVLVDGQGEGMVVSNDEGEVFYLLREGGGFGLRQTFRPFGDLADPGIGSMEFLFGDATLIVTGRNGENRLFSLYVEPERQQREFGWTKTFPALAGRAAYVVSSPRNKAFLVGHGDRASLRYGTTEAVRWEATLPFEPVLARVGGRYDRLVFLDAEHRLHLHALRDPHPEAGWRGMFGRLWYEGADGSGHVWQSTGGSDEYEPKLSLVPLLMGTAKGTLYAMLFATPIALLAALYTSQFAPPGLRQTIKPVMEIMAALPSVVLGFLAAFWLAPLLETRVPSVLLMLVGIPAVAVAMGKGLESLPARYRARLCSGREIAVLAPLLAGVAWGCSALGPVIERWWFVVSDPVTGEALADFRLWWPEAVGAAFEQRNAMVVGFAMGFAVIPIVFSIAEDALSSVPATLWSGSLALGASRWQTAMRIVVPTASAGIFAALMIGLGRAVGETMIVVMATGNTPILEWNPFSGMRALSANLAVELPEAPHGGTLYRTLFLGAMVLFLMTFLMNTVAELLRQRLRERYRLV